MLTKSNLITLFYIFLLIPIFFTLPGCKVVQTIDSFNGILEEPPPDPEQSTLLQAEYAFFEGNYQLAEELFLKIKQTSENPVNRNHALYGLASTKVITAENTSELKDAFTMLAKWSTPNGEAGDYVENPKMMAQALNEKVALLECVPEIRYVTTKKEGELVKKHQDEITELKATIERLEHQISVLEAIDQEIQEKRKPI